MNLDNDKKASRDVIANDVTANPTFASYYLYPSINSIEDAERLTTRGIKFLYGWSAISLILVFLLLRAGRSVDAIAACMNSILLCWLATRIEVSHSKLGGWLGLVMVGSALLSILALPQLWLWVGLYAMIFHSQINVIRATNAYWRFSKKPVDRADYATKFEIFLLLIYSVGFLIQLGSLFVVNKGL